MNDPIALTPGQFLAFFIMGTPQPRWEIMLTDVNGSLARRCIGLRASDHAVALALIAMFKPDFLRNNAERVHLACNTLLRKLRRGRERHKHSALRSTLRNLRKMAVQALPKPCGWFVDPFKGELCPSTVTTQVVYRRKSDGDVMYVDMCADHAGLCNDEWEPTSKKV